MELFLLLNFIHGGEYLHSGKLACSGGEFLLFCQKISKIPGSFCFKCRNQFVLGGDKKHCVSDGRDKEHGPKLSRLKPLLKLNISNNCTITDN